MYRLKFSEYLDTLPSNIISGEDVKLHSGSLRDIFRLVEMKKDDVFYHLGCSDEEGLEIAVDEFGVRRAVGVDNNESKIKSARERSSMNNVELICDDIRNIDISDGTVFLFWFTDDKVIEDMLPKFLALPDGSRVVTIWGPLSGYLPEKVKFPYVMCTVPFKQAPSMREQLLAVLGVECVDFITAWEFAERYTKAIGDPSVKNDRFLTIIQMLVIWINAKNLGVACGDQIPESIKTYIGIMKMHFDIDFEYLLK